MRQSACTERALVGRAAVVMALPVLQRVHADRVGEPARHKLLEHLADALGDWVLAGCMPALIEAAEHHSEIADFLHEYSDRRRSTLTMVLRRIEAGAFPEHLDPEWASLALSGPIFYRRLMTHLA